MKKITIEHNARSHVREVLVHNRRGLQPPHVERVQVIILVRDDEVERLDGVPRNPVRTLEEHNLAQGLLLARVVERDRTVAAAGGEQVRLRLRVRVFDCAIVRRRFACSQCSNRYQGALSSCV